jgi:ABC-2 type transport system ATP-binding protein
VVPLGIGEANVDEHNRRLSVPVTGGAAVLIEALRALDAAGVELQDVGLRRPTLDDVFLTLTGHAAEETEAEDDDQSTPTTKSSTKTTTKAGAA